MFLVSRARSSSLKIKQKVSFLLLHTVLLFVHLVITNLSCYTISDVRASFIFDAMKTPSGKCVSDLCVYNRRSRVFRWVLPSWMWVRSNGFPAGSSVRSELHRSLKPAESKIFAALTTHLHSGIHLSKCSSKSILYTKNNTKSLLSGSETHLHGCSFFCLVHVN